MLADSVELPAPMSMTVETTETLTAIIPANYNMGYTWTSDNPAVATVRAKRKYCHD